MSKYKQQPKSAAQPKKEAKKDDFDAELVGRSVRIRLMDGGLVEGVVTDSRRFWLRVLCDGRIVFINKAAIMMVET
ncbi:MAG: hypothetical protein QXU69_09425 [Thermofilaceae archaeon]